MRNTLIRYIEGFIFSIRWMLIPLYIGLVAALSLYIAHFIHEVFNMFFDFYSNYNQQNVLMLFILELVDMTMISQLVVMTIQGGYTIFVKDFDYNDMMSRPHWLNANLGSSEQKIKMGMSIIGVMIVHFLRDFIESGAINQHDLWMRLALLSGVIIATLSFCAFNLLMHHPMLNHNSNKEEHK